ncbi:hypothetical protein AAVH_22499 [Aphelenchoides avenae]|nr:hypothetical protein AAVH_22499 [Aphelenchus avenae]
MSTPQKLRNAPTCNGPLLEELDTISNSDPPFNDVRGAAADEDLQVAVALEKVLQYLAENSSNGFEWNVNRM